MNSHMNNICYDQIFMPSNISDSKYYLKLKTKNSNCFVAFWYIFSSRTVGYCC